MASRGKKGHPRQPKVLPCLAASDSLFLASGFRTWVFYSSLGVQVPSLIMTWGSVSEHPRLYRNVVLSSGLSDCWVRAVTWFVVNPEHYDSGFA